MDSMYPVYTDGDGKNFKIGFEDWDIMRQGTASLGYKLNYDVMRAK